MMQKPTSARFSRSPRRNLKLKVPPEIAQLEAASHRLQKQSQESNGHADVQATTAETVVYLSHLRNQKVDTLAEMAESAGIENAARMRKSDLLFALVKMYSNKGAHIIGDGVLEMIAEGGYGFLRFPDRSYTAGHGDIYVGPNQIRRFYLRPGDEVSGELRIPQDKERYFALSVPQLVNGEELNEKVRRRTFFENLTPLFASERLTLERDLRADENITARIIDLIAPIGKGQRGLLVASPKSGKTVILQQIAHAIEDNHPDVKLIILLVDERPEEVTEMQRSVRGEVVSSTFDEGAAQHVHVAEIVMEKAKRMVEKRKDVVILLDSITRLARAYNTMQPTSGRVLSGGVDAQALHRPKRFFGAARNVEEGGSLTIIATALVDTGSKMDEVIYEEFKGTGNMELHLDRRIAERRTYPSILIGKSGTRREELLIEPDILKNVWVLRKALASMEDDKAIEMLLDKMRQTKTNDAFFELMKKGV